VTSQWTAWMTEGAKEFEVSCRAIGLQRTGSSLDVKFPREAVLTSDLVALLVLTDVTGTLIIVRRRPKIECEDT
jgi:hypothetical protein